MFGILFYSVKCESSRNLLRVMENQDILKFFTQKCVDQISTDELIKMGLKNVPTLVVLNRNGTTHTKQIFEKSNAFDWIERLIQNRRETMLNNVEKNRKLIQINNIKMKIQDGIDDFNPLESSGISDNYSSWLDDISKDKNEAHSKSFLPYGEDGNYKIITFDDDNNKKLNDQEYTKRSVEVNNVREQQDKYFAQEMEKSHVNAIMKTELGYNN